MDKNYVQYGCGLSAPNGWKNFDSSPSLIFSKIPIVKTLFKKYVPPFPKNVKFGNIVNGLPIEDGTAMGVYASHVLEHLSLMDFKLALNNTYKIMRKDAVFRLVVPDLEGCIRQYDVDPAQTRSYQFMRNTHLGIEEKGKGLIGFMRNLIGQSSHLWMWDFISLKLELEAVGFREIRRAQFNDSKDLKFKEVEDENRFTNCLAIECKK